MSRYGRPSSVYGTFVYGVVVVQEFDASPFTATALDYTSVQLDWRTPGGSWDPIRLVRSSGGYPLTESDGVRLLEEPRGETNTTTFVDTGLTSGRVYYYALFVFDTTLMVWRRVGVADVLVPRTFGYADRLYSRLPAVFKVDDLAHIGDPPEDTSSFLYRYLQVVGYQLDAIRSEYEALLTLLDARTVKVEALPALAAQVGVTYEPQLGSRAMRRLVQGAVHLYGLKGTRAGARELATVVTGWGATVRTGYNLALDDLDAGPKGGRGRWRGRDGTCTVDYRATRDGDPSATAGDGVLVVTPVGGQPQAVAWMCAEPDTPYRRLLTAVPVVQGRPFTASIYAATPRMGLQARVVVSWLSAKGTFGGADEQGQDEVLGSAYAAQPSVQTTVPVGARYAELSVVLTRVDGSPLAVEDAATLCGLLVDEYAGLRQWQCARETIVRLRADAVNEVPNTSAATDTYDWTGYAGATLDRNGSGFVVSGGSGRMLKGSTIGSTPGERWFVAAEVLAGVGAAADLSVVPYAAGQSQGTVAVDSEPVDGATFVRVSGVYTAPEGSTGFRVLVGADGGAGVRRVLVSRGDTPVDFFDGATRTPSGDNLWEGAPFRSRSHHYEQRTTRAARLRSLLRDFLPNGSCFSLEFAQPSQTVVGSPTGVESFVLNPGKPGPPPPVGRTVELQWSEQDSNGRTLSLSWNVGSLTAGRTVALGWRAADTTGSSSSLAWAVSGVRPVGAGLDLRWQTLQTSTRADAPASAAAPGWQASLEGDGYSASNLADATYPGPSHQTGSLRETSLDRSTVHQAAWVVPNQGETVHLVGFFGPPATSAAQLDLLGYDGTLLYRWTNPSARWDSPSVVGLRWAARVAAGATSTLRWASRALSRRDESLSWTTRQNTGSTATEVWNISDTGYAGGYSGGY